jgi:uncharacterized protein (UPF0332 family)
MGFDWNLYIEVASALLDDQRSSPTPKEEYLRTIISRLYYGVFCIARNYLKSKGEILPEKEVHSFVRRILINSSDKVDNQIGRNLLNLWNKRRIADYDDDQSINLFDARTAHQTTYITIQNLKKVGAIRTA